MRKFIAIVALSPWVAYHLLSLVAACDAAWSFVSASLWVGTPILVVVAALRAYDEGLKQGRFGRFGSCASNDDRPPFQSTQMGHLN